MKSISLLSVFLVGGIFAADPAPPATPADIAEAAKGYAKFQKMLPEPKDIGAEFRFLCRPSHEAKSKKYGPHAGASVQYYRNSAAVEAAGAKTWPAGSILVKEKLGQDRKAATAGVAAVDGVAGMIKRAPGTFPKLGDWEFFWVEKGKVQHTGMDSCAGCHSGAAKDYVFTTFPEAKAK